MKKSLFYLCVLICTMQIAFSQSLSENSYPAIALGYLKNYNPDKLTVRSVYYYVRMQHINMDADDDNSLLCPYDYIISINGKAAESYASAEEAMLAASVPGTDGRVEIEYHSMRKNKNYHWSYVPYNVQTIGMDELGLYGEGHQATNLARFAYIDGKAMSIRTDNSVSDWSKYRRIAFQPTSNDPLLEKEYFKIAWNELDWSGFPLIYDEENPDLIVTIAIDEDLQVESTYVPQTTQYMDNGSNSYIYKSGKNIYVNSFKKPAKKVTSGGYTHREYLQNHFIELTILDAKKMKDPNQKVPPVVWQLRYKTTHVRPLSLKTAAYHVLAGCRAFPGVNVGRDVVMAWSGICWEAQTNKSIISYIYKNSPAEKLGLQVGDELLKIDGKKSIDLCVTSSCDGEDSHTSKFSDRRLSFKNQSWYKMLEDAFICPVVDNNLFKLPEVKFYSQDRYTNELFVSFAPDVFRPNSIHEIEIKRDGKKMKLKGILYAAATFDMSTQRLRSAE